MPILDYLRYGELLIPSSLNRQAVLREAEFYSIDVLPGICGDIKEGLYTSSQWILFLERYARLLSRASCRLLCGAHVCAVPQ